MRVRDFMTSGVVTTAPLDATLAQLALLMRDANVSAIPIVLDDNSLAGIVTARDIVVRAVAEARDPNECTAEEILGEQIHTIHPDANIEEAAELMASRQIRRLPVVEDAVIVGLISMDDLVVQPANEETNEAVQDVSQAGRKPVSRAARDTAPQRDITKNRSKRTHPEKAKGSKKVTPIRSRSRSKRRAS